MRCLFLTLVACVLLPSELQAETLTGTGKVSISLVEGSSSYTTTGQLYGDAPGSFTLTLHNNYLPDLTIVASVTKLLDGEKFNITNSEGRDVGGGKCRDMDEDQRYFLDMVHEGTFYLDAYNLRSCEMSIHLYDNILNWGNTSVGIEKIFDKDNKLLLIEVTAYGSEGVWSTGWEFLTDAGRQVLEEW